MGNSGGNLRKLVGMTAVVLAALAAAAAPASAQNRYAHPDGVGAAPCTQQGPPDTAICPIGTALNAAQPGDDVTLLGTAYTVNSSLQVFEGTTVHGTPGAPVTINTSSVTDALSLETGTALRDVVINHTGDGNTLELSGAVTVERVAAKRNTTMTGGDAACYLLNSPALIRDSVCWNRATDEAALWVDATNGQPQTVTLRNLTAFSASGHGILASTRFAMPGTNLTVRATNVIARGQDDSEGDVFADNDDGDPSSVVLDFSNYNEVFFDPGSSVTAVAAPGTGNVATVPAFVDAVSGDFTQQATSTGTIDRGTSASVNGIGLGPFALSGEPRCMGAAPDIGADEFAGGACATPSAGTTVAETGLRAAALAECKRKAKKKDWSKKRRKRCRRKAELLPL